MNIIDINKMTNIMIVTIINIGNIVIRRLRRRIIFLKSPLWVLVTQGAGGRSHQCQMMFIHVIKIVHIIISLKHYTIYAVHKLKIQKMKSVFLILILLILYMNNISITLLAYLSKKLWISLLL